MSPEAEEQHSATCEDDCQLPCVEDDMDIEDQEHESSPAPDIAAAKPHADGANYCRHRIFGRGKIVRHLSPDKVQVHFPGFGLKVILREYLILE